MSRYRCGHCGYIFDSMGIIPCQKCRSLNSELLPQASGGCGTPAIVTEASREKAERIAFVNRVAERLYVNNEVSCMQSIECAELLYRTLKEWESKQ